MSRRLIPCAYFAFTLTIACVSALSGQRKQDNLPGPNQEVTRVPSRTGRKPTQRPSPNTHHLLCALSLPIRLPMPIRPAWCEPGTSMPSMVRERTAMGGRAMWANE